MAKRLLWEPPETKISPRCVQSFRRVQFDEVDVLAIVWHGRYLSYFEQGRNDWGRKHNFSYMTMRDNGFVMPIVSVSTKYLQSLRYDEEFVINTCAHWCDSAKLYISYEIYKKDGQLAASGNTVQAYTDFAGNLMIIRPQFAEEYFNEWAASNA